MKKTASKLFSLILSIAIVMTLFPAMMGSAAESGTCGDNLTWVLDNGTLTISGTGDMWDWDWPSSYVPWHDNDIQRVVINNGITSIGSFAFWACNSLTDITIPGSVTAIGSRAFEGCTSLADITIPDSVSSIGNYAFQGCTSLTNITIPNSVTTIGWYAFCECTSLTNITIPNSVATIKEGAFHGCANLTNITIPDSVTTIEERAFYGCTSLTGVYYGGNKAQWQSIAIGSVNAPLTKATIHYNGNESGNCGDNLTWTLEDGTLTISGTGDMWDYIDYEYHEASTEAPWFDDRPSIHSIVIEEGVTSIGESAFVNFYSLTNVKIPNSVVSIGNYAFYNCYELSNITIPDSVTSIGDYAFYECDLTNIEISAYVTNIGYDAFYGCDLLANIEVDKNNQYYTAESNVLFNKNKDILIFCSREKTGEYSIPNTVTTIGDGAFCLSKLTQIDIPTSVTVIGNKAFYACRRLTSITIPSNVTSIGDYAFYESRITNIVIPEGVTTINEYTFYHSDLTSITIPDGVTNIGRGAFYDCKLTSITIPSSVTTIGIDAFYDYSGHASLTDVYYSGSEEQWQSITIESGNESLTNAAIHYNNSDDGSISAIGKYISGAKVTVTKSDVMVSVDVALLDDTIDPDTIACYITKYDENGGLLSCNLLSKQATDTGIKFTGIAQGKYSIMLWDSDQCPLTRVYRNI